jgi:hypothetical protein
MDGPFGAPVSFIEFEIWQVGKHVCAPHMRASRLVLAYAPAAQRKLWLGDGSRIGILRGECVCVFVPARLRFCWCSCIMLYPDDSPTGAGLRAACQAGALEE